MNANIFLVVYDGIVAFWGAEESVNDFLEEHPLYVGVCEVITWAEYLAR